MGVHAYVCDEVYFFCIFLRCSFVRCNSFQKKVSDFSDEDMYPKHVSLGSCKLHHEHVTKYIVFLQ